MNDIDYKLPFPDLISQLSLSDSWDIDKLIMYYNHGPEEYRKFMQSVKFRVECFLKISNKENMSIRYLLENKEHPFGKILETASIPVFEYYGLDSAKIINRDEALTAINRAVYDGYIASLVEKYMHGEPIFSGHDVIYKNSCNVFLINLSDVIWKECNGIFKKLAQRQPGSRSMTPAQIDMQRRQDDRETFNSLMSERLEKIRNELNKEFFNNNTVAYSRVKDISNENAGHDFEYEFRVIRYLVDSGFYFGRIKAIENPYKH